MHAFGGSGRSVHAHVDKTVWYRKGKGCSCQYDAKRVEVLRSLYISSNAHWSLYISSNAQWSLYISSNAQWSLYISSAAHRRTFLCISTSAATRTRILENPRKPLGNQENTPQNQLLRKSVLVVKNATFDDSG